MVELTSLHTIQILYLGRPPTVHALIWVSDDGDAIVRFGKAPHEFVLYDIGVLVVSSCLVGPTDLADLEFVH
jgi:hypothetical protein